MLLSVIIPVLNEEKNLAMALESAFLSGADEVIVIDGGSQDRSKDIAKKHGAKLLCVAPGRGKQLLAGVKEAQGDFFLFLHADTFFAHNLNLKSYLKAELEWGYFPLQFYPSTFELKIIAKWINFRAKYLHLPYGDQGLLFRRDFYERVGGLKDMVFLEDLDLVLRARRLAKPRPLPNRIMVSSRKLKPHLLFYPTLHSLKNLLIVLFYLGGFSPETLKKIYKF